VQRGGFLLVLVFIDLLGQHSETSPQRTQSSQRILMLSFAFFANFVVINSLIGTFDSLRFSILASSLIDSGLFSLII
jgi:hypothetical protein